MKVILQHTVQKLGSVGDVIEAAPGYFRNYLQPRGLAVIATEGTLKKREEDLAILRKKAELAHQADLELSEKINAIGSLTITAKSGEDGKLYGKVTGKEIALAIKDTLGIEIDKRIIKTFEDINYLGTYKCAVKIGHGIQSEFKVEVSDPDQVTP
jgi:large subunit ribosomal protein L9